MAKVNIDNFVKNEGVEIDELINYVINNSNLNDLENLVQYARKRRLENNTPRYCSLATFCKLNDFNEVIVFSKDNNVVNITASNHLNFVSKAQLTCEVADFEVCNTNKINITLAMTREELLKKDLMYIGWHLFNGENICEARKKFDNNSQLIVGTHGEFNKFYLEEMLLEDMRVASSTYNPEKRIIDIRTKNPKMTKEEIIFQVEQEKKEYAELSDLANHYRDFSSQFR